MTFRRNILASLVILTALGATPALADKGHHDHDRDRKHDNGRHLARGHDKDHKQKKRHTETRDRRDHHARAGDRFSRSGYSHVRNPSEYRLEQRRDWEYYRKDNEIYRVDRQTQRVLAVINLLNVFTN
jgi:hypothetical protein